MEYFGDDDTAVSQSCLILQYIISCLSNCLLHDSGALVTKEVFDLLLQPLINQVKQPLINQIKQPLINQVKQPLINQVKQPSRLLSTYH